MAAPRSSNQFLARFCSDVIDVVRAADVELAALKVAPTSQRSSREWLRVMEETARMATQLLEVVSWVAAQSAVEHGEISQKRAIAEFFPVAHEKILALPPDPDTRSLPARLEKVFARSRGLYEQVAHLKADLRRASAYRQD